MNININIEMKWSPAVCLLLMACGPVSRPDEQDNVRRQVLQQLSFQVVIPALEQAQTRAEALRDATAGWAKAPESMVLRNEAQTAFKRAYVAWQHTASMQLGPAGAPNKFIDGAGVAESINGWPQRNLCRVDLTLADKRYEDLPYLRTALVSNKSFVALEYLLFESGGQNACDAAASINTQGIWNHMDSAELRRRRASYALAVAQTLVDDLQLVTGAWSNGFADRLSNAGTENSNVPSASAALNEVFHAIIAVDAQVKDLKLAAPLGIKLCGTLACEAETPLAQLGRASLLENVAGLRRMLFVSENPSGLGLDKLLEVAGAPELAAALDEALGSVESKVSMLSVDIHAAAGSEPQKVNDALVAFRALSSLLKNQLVTALNFSLPAEGAGDND
jgi:predicted lipoprotein